MKDSKAKTTKSPLQAEIEARLGRLVFEYPIRADLSRNSLHLGCDGHLLPDAMTFWQTYIQNPESDSAKRFDDFVRLAVYMGFDNLWFHWVPRSSRSLGMDDYLLVAHFPPTRNKADL